MSAQNYIIAKMIHLFFDWPADCMIKNRSPQWLSEASDQFLDHRRSPKKTLIILFGEYLLHPMFVFHLVIVWAGFASRIIQERCFIEGLKHRRRNKWGRWGRGPTTFLSRGPAMLTGPTTFQ